MQTYKDTAGFKYEFHSDGIGNTEIHVYNLLEECISATAVPDEVACQLSKSLTPTED